MPSVVPDVIDWLLEEIPALSAVTSVDATVSDGWPDVELETGVAVGVVPDGQVVEVEAEFAQLGGGMEEERSFVPGLIWSWVGGDGAGGAQKAARDRAFAILTAMQSLIRAHPSLDDILQSGAAQITSYPLRQTATAMQAGEGRRAEILFVVTFNHRF